MKISNFIKYSTLMAAVMVISVGCASTQQENAAASKKGAACEQALKHAEAARKKAGSIGHEWRDIKKFMKKAKKALKKGDADKCLKLANKARRQGELGYAQGVAEAKK